MEQHQKRSRLPRMIATFAASVTLLTMAPSLALAQEIMFCGNTGRTGADLYGAAGPYTEVNSCTPTPDTQALLVTRGGTVAGNGPDWLAFLNGGGALITEFGNSHTVYNEIYGTAYTQGLRSGVCSDNVMPQVKLNPSHPFWQANDIDVTPAGQEGCGFDITALTTGETEVTELGADLSGEVKFAIRPQGDGVFFLLEADWQDNEASYSADSALFMAALIEGGTFSAPPPPAGEPTAIPTLSIWGLGLLSGMLALLGLRRVRRAP